jgi:hypothetical protein
MSRPHGAGFRAQKGPERIIKSAPSFQEARRALVGMLENLSFVKVVSVQNGSKPGTTGTAAWAEQPRGIYVGEAVEINFRDAREKPKLVFFDKLGRSRALLKVGPVSLAQAPLGPEHPSAIPTVGEVLVGSLVPNTRKSHLEHVLRGWSSDAKPLWELLRILKFGTKASEFECRSILVQPASMLMQSPPIIKRARDDIYMLARVVLWGALRPLQLLACDQEPAKFKMAPGHEATPMELEQIKTVCLSSSASEYMDSLVLKLMDPTLSEALQTNMEVSAPPEPVDIYSTVGSASMALQSGGAGHYTPAYSAGATAYSAGATAYGATAYGAPAAAYGGAAATYGGAASAAYGATAAAYGGATAAGGSTTPPYVPTSPAYAPTSPAYAPTSPPAGQPAGPPAAGAPIAGGTSAQYYSPVSPPSGPAAAKPATPKYDLYSFADE